MHEVPIAGKYNWMKVVDVMTEAPVTVTPSDPIGRAMALMLDHAIRQLPVVEGTELVGIVTDRDLRSILNSSLLLDPAGMERAQRTLVGAVMSRPPRTLSPNDDLSEAVVALLDEKFGGFPVVDQKAGLIGIVTYIDLLRCFLQRLRED